MAATDALLADALRADPSRPLLTFYDDATGERTELSATTLAGWVAKTAGLIQDELAVEPGDRVAVLLPAHWQTAAVLLGGWSAGAVLDTDPVGAVAAFGTAETAPQARAAGVEAVVALPLLPLGRPFAQPPAGTLDYAAVVPGQPDHFVPYQPVPDDAPACVLAGAAVSGTQLVAQSRRHAAGRLGPGDRVLSTEPWSGPEQWRDLLLAPLAAGASLVLCLHPDPDGLTHRIEIERITVEWSSLTLSDTDCD